LSSPSRCCATANASSGAAVRSGGSAAYGHHLGHAVGFAVIHDPDLLASDELTSTELAVDIAGRLAEARVSRPAFYDPADARLRS